MKEIDDLFASADPSDTYSAIIQAGKKRLLEYRARVVPFLDSPERDLRKAAIWTLAFFWSLPEYEAKAREMAYHDPDDQVRGVAISGWSRFHDNTKDRATILEMLAILLDKTGMPAARDNAYVAIMTVAGVERSRFPKAQAYPDIDKNVDWQLVREMVVSAGIEPPPELEARVAVARIDDLFASSNPSDIYSAIIQAGKKRLLEYRPRVVPFLDSEDRDLRKAAIWTLAFFWALPEFETKAREMAYHDPDQLVRGVAISGWSRFHVQTRNRALILEMLAILLDRDAMAAMRSSAYRAILTIAGIQRLKFPSADVYPDIDKNVDWKLVREMVISAGIEPPPELQARLTE